MVLMDVRDNGSSDVGRPNPDQVTRDKECDVGCEYRRVDTCGSR